MESSFLKNDWPGWQKLTDKSLRIENHLPMSRLSCYGDNIWDFHDSNNPRLSGKSPYQLIVKWHEYEDKLPAAILESIKVFGFFCVHCPAIISSNRRVSFQGLSPVYYCQFMNVALSFFSEVCIQAMIPGAVSDPKQGYIQALADITLLDIRKAFDKWNTKSLVERLEKILSVFTSPVIQQHLPVLSDGRNVVGWNFHDVKTLDLPPRKKSAPGQSDEYSDKPIPDDLFSFLTDTATKDISLFLDAIGKNIEVTANVKNEYKIFSKNSNLDFCNAYNDYIEYSNFRFECVKKNSVIKSRIGLKQTSRANQFFEKHGIKHGEMRELIERIQTAAKYLLIQFTGLRYTEVASIKKGCIIMLSPGDYVIKGTVIKGRSTKSITGLDYWVACPIVRDAVVVLEELTKFTQSEHLFATNKYSKSKTTDKSVTGGALNNMLSIYLYNVDKDRKYSYDEAPSNAQYKGVQLPYRLTTHRLRHTLALHMSRAGLSIPYLSLHLKHVYQAHERFNSMQNVTLSYGGIGSDIFNNAVGIKQATRELVNSVYHPDAPIVGPGAEEFKQKRAFYFAGMQSHDWEIEDIMEYLSDRGLPMADVGLGLCQGQRKIEVDGKQQLPPCLGQLKCSPSHCPNAIIPQSKVPIWIKMYKENLKHIDDPLMAHAKPESIQFIKEAEQILNAMGINVSDL
jgi:integrase